MNQRQPDNQALYATGLRLWNEWTVMWNERPELALEIVASHFALHLPAPSAVDPTTVTTPEAVMRWVTAHRATFKRLQFHTRTGPFVDTVAGVVAGPWYAEASLAGTERWVCGMDTIAFHEGKITAYWTLSKEVADVARWSLPLTTRT
jgi:hypothetical protein